MEELAVPPGRKMVSFHVRALVTSISMTETVSMIKERLNQNKTLKDSCELSVDQITTLLEICLTTTFFYNGVFYKQKGAVMDSLVHVQHIEEKPIREAPPLPNIWLRYMDDTFRVLQKSRTVHTTSDLYER